MPSKPRRGPGSSDGAPTEEQVAIYERFVPMLNAAHREMSELSKKKQDGVLNTLKIRNINRLLDGLADVLRDDPSFGLLERLDEDTLPQNSDAVLLLSQWQAALKQFHDRHHGYDGGEFRWFTTNDARSRG